MYYIYYRALYCISRLFWRKVGVLVPPHAECGEEINKEYVHNFAKYPRYRRMAEKHKQQVVLRPPPAEPGPNGAYLQEEAQRLLQSCLSGNTGSLTEEGRKALHMVRLVVAELEAAVGKNQDWSPASCFLGSQVIQFALAVRSAIQGVSLKGQRNIYKERLSTEALGAGRQDAGEQLENRVGRIPSASLEKLSSMLEPFLSHVVAHLPPGSHSVLTILDDGIQAETPVRIREVHRARALQILLLRQSLLMAMIHLHMHLRGTKNSFEASSQYWSNRGTKFISPFWSRGSEDSEEGKSQSLSVSAARIIGTGFVTCWTNGIAYSKFTEAIQATLKFHWKRVGAKSDPTWVLHDSCWQCHQQSTFSHEYCGGNSNVRQSLPQCYVKRPWFHKPSRLASLLHSLLMHLTDRDGWGERGHS